MRFEDEIAAFFAGYVEAFARGDADAVAASWDPVALFPSPGGNVALERPAFRAHCVALMDFYRRQGVVRPEGELLAATELFPGVAQARVAYRMIGTDGAPIAQWDHVYILRRADGWRVSAAVADGEMAAWTALGARF